MNRESLTVVLSKHGESYDSDCGYYTGCRCGWDNGTDDHNDGYEDHLAGVVVDHIGGA